MTPAVAAAPATRSVNGAATDLLFEDIVREGATWSHVLKRGTALRLTDIDGGANVAALFYNWRTPLERYNMPDTLKAQHTARLTAGRVLYSDMGRDPLLDHRRHAAAGTTRSAAAPTRRCVRAKYGEARYQEHRNDCSPQRARQLLIELGKYGLGTRDLGANVNFFSKVVVDDDGRAGVRAGPLAGRATLVELRAEMNVLVVLTTPASTRSTRTRATRRSPVALPIDAAPPPGADDPCRAVAPRERARLRPDRTAISRSMADERR